MVARAPFDESRSLGPQRSIALRETLWLSSGVRSSRTRAASIALFVRKRRNDPHFLRDQECPGGERRGDSRDAFAERLRQSRSRPPTARRAGSPCPRRASRRTACRRVRVWLIARSVKGTPTSIMPWWMQRQRHRQQRGFLAAVQRLSTTKTRRRVCPTSAPSSHRLEVPSRKYLSGAAMLPKRVGLPNNNPSQRAQVVERRVRRAAVGHRLHRRARSRRSRAARCAASRCSPATLSTPRAA